MQDKEREKDLQMKWKKNERFEMEERNKGTVERKPDRKAERKRKTCEWKKRRKKRRHLWMEGRG